MTLASKNVFMVVRYFVSGEHACFVKLRELKKIEDMMKWHFLLKATLWMCGRPVLAFVLGGHGSSL